MKKKKKDKTMKFSGNGTVFALTPEMPGACRPHSRPWGWSPESCWYPDYQTQPASASWLPPGSSAPRQGRSDPDAAAARGTSGPPADSSRTCSPHPRTSLPFGGEKHQGERETRFSSGALSRPLRVHLWVNRENRTASILQGWWWFLIFSVLKIQHRALHSGTEHADSWLLTFQLLPGLSLQREVWT